MGTIITAEMRLNELKEQVKTPASAKQKKSLEIRINKKEEEIKKI